MKKYLTMMTASTLLTASLSANMDFFIGYEASIMEANNAANANRLGLDETQKGIGFGLRIHTEVNPSLDIGGEFGLSHLETRSETSGSIAHAQFLLKYHISDNIEIFGGLGVAARGTPDDSNTSVSSSATLLGGGASAGIAFVTEDLWRIDATAHYFSFTGTIDSEEETISTTLVGVHVGKTFNME
jgi:hypothetical protein